VSVSDGYRQDILEIPKIPLDEKELGTGVDNQGRSMRLFRYAIKGKNNWRPA
jgi:hypothetical protein